MAETLLKNHEFNFIKKQVHIIKDSYKKGLDPNVLNAVKDSAIYKIQELLSEEAFVRLEMLELTTLRTDDQFDQYIEKLAGYKLPFPKVSEQQLKKLFPKNKKLKVPNLSELNEFVTYLGWNDIGTNKKFIVYELDGKLTGLECRFTMATKDNICSFCNTFGKVAFLSTVTKAKRSNNPDYYKSIGNYMCFDSDACNSKISDVGSLERFITESLRES
ncbi:FusB/FusC family EF-G-binding protein [Peribacillus sp. SCS-155]|uniref:FusB/FusC family EF-G-binding protein n=1 Tax=Peribacillus sedimenti TaxID=3115297 RepID=UPI003905C4D3